MCISNPLALIICLAQYGFPLAPLWKLKWKNDLLMKDRKGKIQSDEFFHDLYISLISQLESHGH